MEPVIMLLALLNKAFIVAKVLTFVGIAIGAVAVGVVAWTLLITVVVPAILVDVRLNRP